jgi:predicted O-linked N-acetylglucosamine transferase (SPINDLY family)
VNSGQPNSAAALYQQGNALAQMGRFAEALVAYDRAAAIMPNSPEISLNRGNVLYELGRYAEALANYDAAITRAPGNAVLWNNRGNTLAELGRSDDALASFNRAIQLNGSYPDALIGRADVLSSMGRDNDAAHDLEKALTLAPDSPDIMYRLGVLLLRRERSADALRYFDHALKLDPLFVEAHVARSTALTSLQRHPEALDATDSALRIAPENIEAFINRANLLSHLKRFEEALIAADRALKLAPNSVAAWHNYGVALAGLNRAQEALGAYQKALSLDSKHVATLTNSAVVLMSRGDHEAALLHLDCALSLNAGDPDIWSHRGKASANLNRFGEAVEHAAKALMLNPDHIAAQRLAIHARLRACDWRRRDQDEKTVAEALSAERRVIDPLDCLAMFDSSAENRAAAKLWMLEVSPPAQPITARADPAHERIRVAYLSTDFRAHVVGAMIAGVFEHHDRARFETFAFSLGPNNRSKIRARIEAAADRFIEAREMPDAAVAKLMRDCEIDIVIDLNGYTGDSRTAILASRPAPVQLNFLGYPGTMAAPYIDYIIADRTVIPEVRQTWYTEKVLYLPNCYQPNDRSRVGAAMPSRRDVGLPETGLVFCCFNNNYKITPAMFGIWMRLLRAVDGSVLWLLADNSAAADNLRREADARGVSPDRLIFAPRAAPELHLARHALADIALDTLPYNAHTTATDALWRGVPLITCPGNSFQSRVAASILTACGVPELIASSLDEYEQLALRLARNPDLLAATRAKLAGNRESCALFDIARFTNGLEAAYLEIAHRLKEAG